ncbi:hypothetical protein [Desulfolucanica intricata]|nr:hypothetical protein [Desulfolucanica intricata]
MINGFRNRLIEVLNETVYINDFDFLGGGLQEIGLRTAYHSICGQ